MQEKPVEILLIEDNPSDIELIKSGFEKALVVNHITVITDGREAVDFINMGVVTPELILLDINQSNGNGFDTLKNIRNSENGKNTPIVILTSTGTKADVIKNYKQYANSFVSKPANCNQYLQVVKSIETFWIASSKQPRRKNYELN